MNDIFRWCYKLIAFLHTDARLDSTELDSIMETALYYHNKGFTPDVAGGLIERNWPNQRCITETDTEPEDTPEETPLSWEEQNLLKESMSLSQVKYYVPRKDMV